jgi:hypothetical protein
MTSLSGAIAHACDASRPCFTDSTAPLSLVLSLSTNTLSDWTGHRYGVTKRDIHTPAIFYSHTHHTLHSAPDALAMAHTIVRCRPNYVRMTTQFIKGGRYTADRLRTVVYSTVLVVNSLSRDGSSVGRIVMVGCVSLIELNEL